MAERRMFTKKVTDSDSFIEMPSATQALYFHLNQAADDDGFNNQIQVAMMKAHASVDDLKILLMKNFVIRFDSGVIVIKHWRMHNTLRKDRYTPTAFKDELAQLNIKENQAYTRIEDGCQVVAKLEPQVSIGKVSIDKDSINNSSCPKNKFSDDSLPVILSKKLYSHIKENNPNAKEPNYQSWAKHIDLMIRKDNRQPSEIETIIDWCQQDSFWYTNILSTDKLRKQFDRLVMGKSKEKRPTNSYQKSDKSNRTNFEQREYDEAYFKEGW